MEKQVDKNQAALFLGDVTAEKSLGVVSFLELAAVVVFTINCRGLALSGCFLFNSNDPGEEFKLLKARVLSSCSSAPPSGISTSYNGNSSARSSISCWTTSCFSSSIPTKKRQQEKVLTGRLSSCVTQSQQHFPTLLFLLFNNDICR